MVLGGTPVGGLAPARHFSFHVGIVLECTYGVVRSRDKDEI